MTIIHLCAALVFLLAPAARAGEISEFAIYLWGAPQVADLEARAQAVAAAGFTVVDWPPEELDVLRNYDLKAMVHHPDEQTAARLSGHPALWGYHLGDEPYPEEKFPPIATQIKNIKKADPHHPAFVNVLSTTGEFLRTYMEVVRPEMLSFDYYQWWWGSDRYFEKLEQFRAAALGAGVPLLSCVEASANPANESGDHSYLPDNARKLRQSLYTTLAYGARGISWYSSNIVFEAGSTELTRTGKDVAALNAELRTIGPVLVQLRSLDVFHTPPLASGTRAAPKEHWVHLIGEEGRPGLVLGMFEDDEGTDYILVANRDYRQSQSVVVRLQSKWLGIAPWHKPKVYSYAVDKFDKESGQWTVLSSSSFVGFTFVIGPGNGELFRIETQIEQG
jgi:hypothetical protein